MSREIRGHQRFHESRSEAMSVPSAVAGHGSIPVTPAGHMRLQDDLRELTTTQRASVEARLRDARSTGGDLADNAELMYALEEHILLEQRIAKLESELVRTRVVSVGADAGRVEAGFASVDWTDKESTMSVPIPTSHPPHQSQAARRGRLVREACARCSPALGPQRRTIQTPLGALCAPCLEWLQISGRAPKDAPDSF
jgi:Transcription elongation factor, N-terminal